MSDEILLRPEEARGAAQDIQKSAAQAKDEAEALKTRLSDLANSFRGASAHAFDERYNEWHTGAQQMLDGLDSLGQFLAQAADALEETDHSIAGQLRG
jgi:WXG100 family type VII secretion target